jgi:hypothetical protein
MFLTTLVTNVTMADFVNKVKGVSMISSLPWLQIFISFSGNMNV